MDKLDVFLFEKRFFQKNIRFSFVYEEDQKGGIIVGGDVQVKEKKPMAFGIKRAELETWKSGVEAGKIMFLTHYWLDPRFPGCRTVTKVGCANLARLQDWCRKHGLDPRYIHRRERYPHLDLFGPLQKRVLVAEGLFDHIRRFGL